MSDTAHTLSLYANLASPNLKVSAKTYYRVVSIVNRILGSDVVSYSSDGLAFAWADDICIEAQKLVYQLVAECFLTPQGISV